MDTVHIEESPVFCHNVNFSLVKRIPQKHLYEMFTVFNYLLVILSYGFSIVCAFCFHYNALQSLKLACSKILCMSFGYKLLRPVLDIRTRIGVDLYASSNEGLVRDSGFFVLTWSSIYCFCAFEFSKTILFV